MKLLSVILASTASQKKSSLSPSDLQVLYAQHKGECIPMEARAKQGDTDLKVDVRGRFIKSSGDISLVADFAFPQEGDLPVSVYIDDVYGWLPGLKILPIPPSGESK